MDVASYCPVRPRTLGGQLNVVVTYLLKGIDSGGRVVAVSCAAQPGAF